VAEATAGAAAATVTKVSDCFAKVSFNTGETGKVDWAIAFQAADTKKERTAVTPPGAVDVRAMRGEIVLRNEPPLWTDQRHDIEGAPLVRGDAPDIGTTAPFWTAWFVGIYTDKQKSLVSEVCNVGEKNTQVFFEVLGDGKRLWASEVLKGGESAPLRVPVEGVKDLTLICHYVGGWFSSTKGVFRNPRLVKE
jgi:hypothetical protein